MSGHHDDSEGHDKRPDAGQRAGTDSAQDRGDGHEIRIVGNEIAWGSTCKCLWRGELHDNERDARREHAEHAEREAAMASIEPAGDWTGRSDRAATISHCCVRHMIQWRLGLPYSGDCGDGPAPTPTAIPLESGAEPPTQVDDRRPAAEAGREVCPRCMHPTARHWPDNEYGQPGCHMAGCLCSYDPDQIGRALAKAAAEAGRADDDGGDVLDLDAIRRRLERALEFITDQAPDGVRDPHKTRRAAYILAVNDVPALIAALVEARAQLVEVKRLVLKPGDVLMAKVAETASMGEVVEVRDRLSAWFPDHEVRVISGVELMVVEPITDDGPTP